ncbi:MAG TPA: ChrR family anti-sigma-E factor [Thermomonas sp.]|nr:ChrR family anti-sigma-E factor [Thermomonas sp.]
MTPRHHLDPATVLSHAAGALPQELSVVVATHLEGCATCREAVARAEGVGGLLIDQQHAQPAREARANALRASMLDRLDEVPPAAPRVPREPNNDPDRIPGPLQPYFGPSYRALKWRWMGPGMHFIRRSGPSGGNLLMLRIGPGKRMPVHSHGGSEITQILSGAYDDALGHFGPGDVADLDSDTEHQPVTMAGVPCICVSALDAPLRFPGWLARKLQPMYGI